MSYFILDYLYSNTNSNYVAFSHVHGVAVNNSG